VKEKPNWLIFHEVMSAGQSTQNPEFGMEVALSSNGTLLKDEVSARIRGIGEAHIEVNTRSIINGNLIGDNRNGFLGMLDSLLFGRKDGKIALYPYDSTPKLKNPFLPLSVNGATVHVSLLHARLDSEKAQERIAYTLGYNVNAKKIYAVCLYRYYHDSYNTNNTISVQMAPGQKDVDKMSKELRKFNISDEINQLKGGVTYVTDTDYLG
jgi:hypothetical protein